MASIFSLIIFNYRDNFKLPQKNLLTLFAISLPALVRIINIDLTRIHGDDLITAFFSATYNFSKFNFFSWIPQEKDQWVAQFPTVYFALQKLFFMIFGESLLAVKLSIIPYVFIVSIFLFLIVRKLLDQRTAIFALILYSFMAVSLYHETLGLHFIASTAAFMAFFYFVILNFQEPSPKNSINVGLSCGFCYLFYISSYLAGPMLILFFGIMFLKYRKPSMLQNLAMSILAFLVVMSPYLTYIYKSGNNYFFQRINQVNLINGEWSGSHNEIKALDRNVQIVKKNLMLSAKSFYLNDIGGHGGYNFGHLAFFERFSLLLFIAGLAFALLYAVKKIELFFILFTIFVAYIVLVVFSIPPPAYHRLSLAFPFIAMISSLPFYFLLNLKKFNRKIKYLIIFSLLIIYAVNNQIYFDSSTQSEINNQTLALASLINSRLPARNLYIASFPGFAFEKIYYFSPGKNAKKIVTDYHNSLLNNFHSGEKYVYLMIFPDVFEAKFKEKDKNGRLLRFSKDYSLFYN